MVDPKWDGLIATGCVKCAHCHTHIHPTEPWRLVNGRPMHTRCVELGEP